MRRNNSESLADLRDEGMRRWRTKVAREMFFYALLSIVMMSVEACIIGMCWDRIVAKLEDDPLKTIQFFGTLLLILLALLWLSWSCIKTARDTLRFNRKMDDLRLRHPSNNPD